MTTMSGRVAARRAAASGKSGAMPNAAPIADRRAASGSQAPAIWMPGTAASAGRWMRSATPPRPMTATRITSRPPESDGAAGVVPHPARTEGHATVEVIEEVHRQHAQHEQRAAPLQQKAVEPAV